MAIIATDPKTWGFLKSTDSVQQNSLQQWALSQESTLAKSSKALKDFFTARGPCVVVNAIAAEMLRCYREHGELIQSQRDQMTISVQPMLQTLMSLQQIKSVAETIAYQQPFISQQPRARGSNIQEISFDEAKYSLSYAFITMIYDQDRFYIGQNVGLEKISLFKIMARNLQGSFPQKSLPPLDLDALITLIAQAICRYIYELMVEVNPYHGPGQFNDPVDKYLSCGQCTIGRTIAPAVLLTSPAITDLCAKLPWITAPILPAAVMLLGLLINEAVYVYSCCGCCESCSTKLGCGCANCHNAGLCEGPNKDQNFSVLPAPTRRQQENAKCQWVMLAIGTIGTSAQIIAPILRKKQILMGSALNVISAPVLLGIDIFIAAIACVIIDNLQKRGYVHQTPWNATLGILKDCFQKAITMDCCPAMPAMPYWF